VGPGGFDIFPNYQTGSNFEIEKECLTVLLDRGIVNNSKFCMPSDWGIVNNSLNCVNVQFSIELDLKILE
jgi:hypothetical protein